MYEPQGTVAALGEQIYANLIEAHGFLKKSKADVFASETNLALSRFHTYRDPMHEIHMELLNKGHHRLSRLYTPT